MIGIAGKLGSMKVLDGDSPLSRKAVGPAARVLGMGLLLAAAGGFLTACSDSDDDSPLEPAPASPQLSSLSTRADTVSGGNVLVEVAAASGTDLTQVKVTRNGADVSSAFSAGATPGKFVGLVDGLTAGENLLVATIAPAGALPSAPTTLRVTNHPITGPIFSGPRQSPWVCETEASGLGVAPATGPCTAPTKIDWFYRTTGGAFQPLTSLVAPYPADLAQTTTIDGNTVNYIVRVESGTINESIYRIAMLDDPAAPVSNPWSSNGRKPGAGWNGKLTYPFGGGASTAYRSGRNLPASALQDAPLSLGFAVAFGTRNTFGTGADDVISAETVSMIKEHFIEQYGVPKFTIGSGGSGGSMQQILLSQNYPGLLDALTPGILYPDLVTIIPDVLDCGLLNNYFETIANPADWPGSRRTAVDGYAVSTATATLGTTVCQNGWSGFAGTWQNPRGNVPARGFDDIVPVAQRYDPVTNPTGARATYWDGQVNVYGKDPATGFARSAYDNVGIQYGLNALNSGSITTTEFLDLNERIGGLDVDGNIVPQRTAGDPVAIANAFRTGRVLTEAGNLRMPIIATRDYRDFNSDIHTRERSFAFLDRMRRENGTTANIVSWTTPTGTAPGVDLPKMALLAHNEWLENLLRDTSAASYGDKVIASKPATLLDACWDAAGTRFQEPVTLDPAAVCNQLFPVHANVRIAAGGPIAGDVLKCPLKPIDFASYRVAFTGEERARLAAIFPAGVCDWTQPSLHRQDLLDTWLEYPAPGEAVSLD